MTLSNAKPSIALRRVLGWTLLLVALPVAFMGIFHAPNEYRQTLGIDALDCDGPLHTYMFAVPALAIYAAGLALNGMSWRRRTNLAVALLCLMVCTALVVNTARAVVEQRHQAEGCAAK
jgi:hypothetical protein